MATNNNKGLNKIEKSMIDDNLIKQVDETSQQLAETVTHISPSDDFQSKVESSNGVIMLNKNAIYNLSGYVKIPSDTKIYGNNSKLVGYGFDVEDSKNIHIVDVHFDGIEDSATKHSGVYSSTGGASDITIEMCTLDSSNIQFERGVEKSDRIRIIHNRFVGNYTRKGMLNCVLIYHCDNIHLDDNKFDALNVYRTLKFVGGKHTETYGDVSLKEDANKNIHIRRNAFRNSHAKVDSSSYTKQCIDFYYGNDMIFIEDNEFDIRNEDYPCESVIESKSHGGSENLYNGALSYMLINRNTFRGFFKSIFKAIGLYGTSIDTAGGRVDFTNNDVLSATGYAGFNESSSLIHCYRMENLNIKNNKIHFDLAQKPSNYDNIQWLYAQDVGILNILHNDMSYGKIRVGGRSYVGNLDEFNLSPDNKTIVKEINILNNRMLYGGTRCYHVESIGNDLPVEEKPTVLNMNGNEFINYLDTQTAFYVSGSYKEMVLRDNKSNIDTFIKDLGLLCHKPIVNENNAWSRVNSAPAGKWEEGQIIYSRKPTEAGCVGWYCIGSGNPAIWQPFGVVNPA